MATPGVKQLPYRADSTELFAPLAGEPWAMFLDSGPPSCRGGRYDIIACIPRVTLITRGQLTEIREGGLVRVSPDDPFTLVRECLGPILPSVPGLPFRGGALGYFGYDLARRIERLPATAQDELRLADMAVGIYDWALVVDHLQRQTWLVGQDHDATSVLSRQRLGVLGLGSKPPVKAEFSARGPLRSSLSEEEYAAGFRRIQRYIYAGDCYQINFARRYSVVAEGDAWVAYGRLRQLNPAPFSAFLNIPSARILSSSPERFLRLQARAVETRPIKGTCRRDQDPSEDARLAAALGVSAKDRAENLMIVDLLRNDLGRTCAVGTIWVPRLFEIASFATVHHLVSTVRGKLADDEDALSLLRGCFPGGSITGAPKIRAMEIIEELEGERRGIYCGNIGYVGFDGDMDTNIAIRTLVHNGRELTFWAGGGIVADSGLEMESQEIAYKMAALLTLVEQFR